MKEAKHNQESPSCIIVPVPALGGEMRSYSGVSQPFVAHAHEYYVVGRVKQGERKLELNDEELRIGPGDFIVFNPGDVHGCRHASEELFAYDSITIAADRLDGMKLAFPQGCDNSAAEAFERLLQTIASGAEDVVMECAVLLAGLLESQEEISSSASSHAEAALRTYAHLLGHLAEPASIGELAAMEGISESALIRAYRRRFSITPMQHLLSLRIECAGKLLAQGAAPADVAIETGFADQAHMTRAFKQRLGTTPAAYRRMTAKGADR